MGMSSMGMSLTGTLKKTSKTNDGGDGDHGGAWHIDVVPILSHSLFLLNALPSLLYAVLHPRT